MKRELRNILTRLSDKELEMDIVEINQNQTEIIKNLTSIGKISVNFSGSTSKGYINAYNSEQDVVYMKNNGNWIIKVNLIQDYLSQNY